MNRLISFPRSGVTPLLGTSPPEVAAADAAYVALLAAAAGGGARLRDAGRDDLDAALRASINRYVVANVRHAELSAARVARRFGISLRKLHRLYESTDRSFEQTVMAYRVEGCAQELAIGTHLSLTESASRWGFSDLSHLNRVFRSHYDCLPSQYRRRIGELPAGEQGVSFPPEHGHLI